MFYLFMLSIGMILASYLIGSVSSAIIIAKICRLPDPRSQGSKNPGATNMLRIGGKGAALATLLGDALKGFIPVYIAKIILSSPEISWVLYTPSMISAMISLLVSAVFLAAVLGHLFPIFFRFEGGKGVATALGGLFALRWSFGISFIIIWLLVAIATRYSALAALIAMAALPIIAFVSPASEYTVVILMVTVLIFWRHRINIQNLMQGKESKIGEKK